MSIVWISNQIFYQNWLNNFDKIEIFSLVFWHAPSHLCYLNKKIFEVMPVCIYQLLKTIIWVHCTKWQQTTIFWNHRILNLIFQFFIFSDPKNVSPTACLQTAISNWWTDSKKKVRSCGIRFYVIRPCRWKRRIF